MSEDRKAKRTRRKAEREARKSSNPLKDMFENKMTQDEQENQTELNVGVPIAPLTVGKVGTPIVSKAVQNNPVNEIQTPDISNPNSPDTKSASPITLASLLAPQVEERRQSAEDEKTEALKMQRYYALTDALGALGKMGGAVVGGAIGGNILDSAPTVGDFKESRGYLDAIERVKKANERLRKLDDEDYQLALRDEEREYRKKVEEEKRAYAEEQNKIAREWQAEQARLKREWDKAVAENNAAEQAKIKEKEFELREKYEAAILALKDQYAAADDSRSLEYLRTQNDLYNPAMPVLFNDGSSVSMTDKQIERMYNNFKGKTVGGVKITKDNFEDVLRANPQAFAGYFNLIGITPTAGSASVETVSETPSSNTEPAEPQQEKEEKEEKKKGVPYPTGARGPFYYPQAVKEKEEKDDEEKEKDEAFAAATKKWEKSKSKRK
jgi:hypothetical protein